MSREQQLSRLETAIEAQKRFAYTVPDPDNRQLAEANLMALIFKRDLFADATDGPVGATVVR